MKACGAKAAAVKEFLISSSDTLGLEDKEQKKKRNDNQAGRNLERQGATYGMLERWSVDEGG